MRKVTTVNQLARAVNKLMSAQPEDGAIRVWIERAIEFGNTTELYWLVHNSDWYKVSGRVKAICIAAP